MHYRFGWPLGRLLAKAGIPTVIRLNVSRDDEAGVYVGTSVDVAGLVLEAETLDEMYAEFHATVPALLDCADGTMKHEPVAAFCIHENFAHA